LFASSLPFEVTSYASFLFSFLILLSLLFLFIFSSLFSLLSSLFFFFRSNCCQCKGDVAHLGFISLRGPEDRVSSRSVSGEKQVSRTKRRSQKTKKRKKKKKERREREERREKRERERDFQGKGVNESGF